MGYDVVDAGAEIGLVDAIYVQRNGYIRAGITKAVDLAQTLGSRSDIPRAAADLATNLCSAIGRIPAVMRFDQVSLQHLIGAPRLVAMHRAELSRAPDQKGDGKGAVWVGISDVSRVAVAGAGSQLRRQKAQHIARIRDANCELAQECASCFQMGRLNRFT